MKKHGFTISELLMSIAIISIVSAMGMTIAKRGTDDAYKNYFAIGTMNLNNALAQIETGDLSVGYDAQNNLIKNPGAGDPIDILSDAENLTEHLRYLFGDDRDYNGVDDIITDNGIIYHIDDLDVNGASFVTFSMTVPAPRTRQNPTGQLRTAFRYDRDPNVQNLSNSRILIPLGQDPDLGNAIRYIDMQERYDLLLAYIDDGIVGRHIPIVFNYRGSSTNTNKRISQDRFVPITYGTFKDAYCTITHGVGNAFVNCSGSESITPRALPPLEARNTGNTDDDGDQMFAFFDTGEDTTSEAGVIKFASPRKVK